MSKENGKPTELSNTINGCEKIPSWAANSKGMLQSIVNNNAVAIIEELLKKSKKTRKGYYIPLEVMVLVSKVWNQHVEVVKMPNPE